MIAAAAAAILLGASPAATTADLAGRERPTLTLVVRQELRQPLTAVLARIAEEVGAIWRPYANVEMTVPGQLPRTVSDDTLALTITDRLSDGRTGDGLGWIDFVNGEPQRAITVSHGRAMTLAEQSSWAGRLIRLWPPGVRQTFLSLALARGIAHEVGHYLLRSKSHGTTGLMRAHYNIDEIMAPGTAKYRLLPEELARLESRFRGYLLARRETVAAGPAVQ